MARSKTSRKRGNRQQFEPGSAAFTRIVPTSTIMLRPACSSTFDHTLAAAYDHLPLGDKLELLTRLAQHDLFMPVDREMLSTVKSTTSSFVKELTKVERKIQWRAASGKPSNSRHYIVCPLAARVFGPSQPGSSPSSNQQTQGQRQRGLATAEAQEARQQLAQLQQASRQITQLQQKLSSSLEQETGLRQQLSAAQSQLEEQQSALAVAASRIRELEEQLQAAKQEAMEARAKAQVGAPALASLNMPVTASQPLPQDASSNITRNKVLFGSDSADLQFNVGGDSKQGLSSKMEDRILVEDLKQSGAAELFKGYKRAALMAVLDGHGGVEAVEHLQSALLAQFVEAYSTASCMGSNTLSEEQVKAVLASTVYRCEAQLVGQGFQSGSTALLALMLDGKLHVANVGDSRAVLLEAGETRALTQDHKVSDPVERERLLLAGAQFSSDGYLKLELQGGCTDLAVSRGLGSAHIKRGEARLAADATQQHPGISGRGLTPASSWESLMSCETQSIASISDFDCSSARSSPCKAQQGPSTAAFLVPHPDLLACDIYQETEFLVLACDGIWDKMRNSEVTRNVRNWLGEGKSCTEAASKLCDMAVKMGSTDNVSAVILRFSSRPIVLPRRGNSMLRRAG